MPPLSGYWAQAPPVHTPLTGASVRMLEQASSVRGLRRRATLDGACYVCQSAPGFRDFLFPSAGACQKAKQIQQQQQLNSAGSFLPDCAPSGSSPSGCGTLRSQREGTHCTHAFCASSEHRHAHHLPGPDSYALFREFPSAVGARSRRHRCNGDHLPRGHDCAKGHGELMIPDCQGQGALVKSQYIS